MNLGAFIEEMEQLAPPLLADDSDHGRIGLIVQGKAEISRICCALDPTPAVIARAAAVSADMLVVHHTPLWNPVTRLTGLTAQIMRELFVADMNLYVMHTNFDRVENGVNDALVRLLSLTRVSSLSLGRVGDCSISVLEISRRLGGGVRIWGRIDHPVNRLAVVAGSGFDPVLLHEAVDHGAGAFLSAEMKHAVARAAPFPCIEATHYALEAPSMRDLAARMGWDFIDDPPITRLFQ